MFGNIFRSISNVYAVKKRMHFRPFNKDRGSLYDKCVVVPSYTTSNNIIFAHAIIIIWNFSITNTTKLRIPPEQVTDKSPSLSVFLLCFAIVCCCLSFVNFIFYLPWCCQFIFYLRGGVRISQSIVFFVVLFVYCCFSAVLYLVLAMPLSFLFSTFEFKCLFGILRLGSISFTKYKILRKSQIR